MTLEQLLLIVSCIILDRYSLRIGYKKRAKKTVIMVLNGACRESCSPSGPTVYKATGTVAVLMPKAVCNIVYCASIRTCLKAAIPPSSNASLSRRLA